MKDSLPNNNEGESLEKMRYVYGIIRTQSVRNFRSALIYGILFIILWTVVGKLIPPGNWMAAFNIVMLLISIWLIVPMTFRFFRIRMDWKWLAIILTAIVWFALVLGIRTFILSVFY